MKTSHVIPWLVVTFACGAAIGYYAVRQLNSSRRIAESEVARPRVEVDALRTEIQKLQEQLAQRAAVPASPGDPPTKGAPSPAALTPLQELAVLADMQQRKLLKPVLTILDRKGKLDSSFADLFALNADEQDRLQRAVDTVRQKLADLERANATVTRDDRGNIVVAIPPFPTDGGKVYDEMMRAFAEVLGPERNDAYRTLAAEQLENSLGRFGAAERTYTFGYDLSERPGQPYTFQDRVMQYTANGGRSGFTNNTRFQSFDELAARVGPVVSILPADYKRGK